MFWHWPQAKKPWFFFLALVPKQSEATNYPMAWPEISQSKAKIRPNSPPKAMALTGGLASDFRKLSGQANAGTPLV
jgi:hypothetical protein